MASYLIRSSSSAIRSVAASALFTATNRSNRSGTASISGGSGCTQGTSPAIEVRVYHASSGGRVSRGFGACSYRTGGTGTSVPRERLVVLHGSGRPCRHRRVVDRSEERRVGKE